MSRRKAAVSWCAPVECLEAGAGRFPRLASIVRVQCWTDLGGSNGPVRPLAQDATRPRLGA